MDAAGWRHSAELIAGTVYGGLGAPYDTGAGFIGGIRGIVSGGLFNAAQGEFQKMLDGFFGLTSKALGATSGAGGK